MNSGLILPGATSSLIGGEALVASARNFIRPVAPSIIIKRFGGSPPPQDKAEMGVDIVRQPLRTAMDWQLEAIGIWREHRWFGPAFKVSMEKVGLGRRCLLLTSWDGGPLRFRYIGEPTRRFFGDAWADAQIGKPQMTSGFDALTKALNEQYMEAILNGEPVHNRLVVHGLPGEPFIYTHTLLGWQQGRWRVMVALVDY